MRSWALPSSDHSDQCVPTLNELPENSAQIVGRRGWCLGGAVLGLTIPIVLRSYEHIWMLGHVPPILYWVLWPASLLNFLGPRSVTVFLVLLVMNAAIYAFLAFRLRAMSLALATFLCVVAWSFLPPSDDSLTRRFGEHRKDLDRLAKMASEDSQMVRMAPELVQTSDGRKCSLPEASSVITVGRLDEYRRLFKTVQARDGLYRNPATGEIFFSLHGVHSVDPGDVAISYVYCASASQEKANYLPCEIGGNLGERGRYSWKMLDSQWYLYKLFHPHAIE
jgi:hypothetical protein